MSSVGEGGGYLPFPPPFPFAFHLLEVTVISAQDLLPCGRSMRTYAEVWVQHSHRLRTRLDPAGHTDPTWNDKFVLRLDDAILRSDTSAVTIDIYAARGRLRPGRDTLLGTARALLSTLRPSTATHFVALQIRRPASLRPQGILNIGVALLDAYARSMPIYAELAVKKPAGTEKEAHLARRGTVAVGGRKGERERSALESKLEKWRAELPPLQDRDGGAAHKQEAERGGMEKRRRSSGRFGCFSRAGEPVGQLGS